jgi:hypothetical protein
MLSALADASRCGTDHICRRVHRLEPSLPVFPSFDPAFATPCISPECCIPAVHVLSGWHMLSPDDGLRPYMLQHPQIVVRERGCFNLWGTSDAGAAEWVRSWGGPPANTTALLATTACSAKVLTWHPEYAGRFWSAATQRFEQCRHNASGACDPLVAHEEVIGSGGVGQEATPPFVLRTLYGGAHIRLIATLRSPVDRLETAFWFHKQFWSVKGPTAHGLHTYASEQVAAFRACMRDHGARRCAFLFERLGPAQAQAFWHCNQIIRGLVSDHQQNARWRSLSDGLMLPASDVPSTHPLSASGALPSLSRAHCSSCAWRSCSTHRRPRMHG